MFIRCLFSIDSPLDLPEWNIIWIVAVVEIKTSGMMSISVNVNKQENSNIMKKKFIIVIKTEIPNLKNKFSFVYNLH